MKLKVCTTHIEAGKICIVFVSKIWRTICEFQFCFQKDSEDETWPNKFVSHHCFSSHSGGMPIRAISTEWRAWSGASILRRYRDTPQPYPPTHIQDSHLVRTHLSRITMRRSIVVLAPSQINIEEWRKRQKQRGLLVWDIQQMAETFWKHRSVTCDGLGSLVQLLWRGHSKFMKQEKKGKMSSKSNSVEYMNNLEHWKICGP